MTAGDLVTTAANDLVRRIDPAQVHTAFSPGNAPRIWNAAVQHRPAVVVRARAPRGVQAAIRVARDHGIRLSVLGGGHDWAGRALSDGGLLIDMSRMRGVRVDASARVATVGGAPPPLT
jgi:FAD/FMN-containing dehydrogenase